MNLVAPELLRGLWIGYTAFCLLSGMLALFRLKRLGQIQPVLRGVQLGGGAVLFLISAVEFFRPVQRPVLQWIYSAAGDSSLKTGFMIDHLSGWGLGIIVLLLLVRACSGESSRYYTAAVGLCLVGWNAAWTSETLWVSLLGFTVIVISAFVVRIGMNGTETEPALHLQRDLIRVGISILGIWTAAAGLEVLGFRWNFSEITDPSVEHLILLPLFLVSLTLLVLPWADLSNLVRPEEKLEADSMLFAGVFLPLAISASLARVFSGAEASVWTQGAGVGTATLGLLFFFVYLAAKSPIERKRALARLFASLTLTVSFLEPGPYGMLYALAVGAIVATVIIGHAPIPRIFKGAVLVLSLLVAAGLPGFIPGAFLSHLWSILPDRPLDLGALLALHGILTIALLREVAVSIYEKESGDRYTQGVAVLTLLLFLLAPWTTATYTGGILPSDIDLIPIFKSLPWVEQFRRGENGSFPEGRWIQPALALIFALLIPAFRRRDPFVTEPQSWRGFRRLIASDAGVTWAFSRSGQGLRWVGVLFEDRVFDRFWSGYVPAAFSALHRVRTKFAKAVDHYSDLLTDEKWKGVISGPSYLVQAMTNGRIHWYLYFAILGTFVLVLHFVVKIS